jgi:hypothetical protein
MQLSVDTKIEDDLTQNILSYYKTGDVLGDFFDFKNFYNFGNPNSFIEFESTITSNILMKNDSALQGWNSTYSGKVNLISRTNGTDYDNEVIIGDGGVKTAIRVENDSYDAVIRKGNYGATTDYLIYSSEHFDYRDIAALDHRHQIQDVENLQSSLNSKFNINGGTIQGSTIFNDVAVFKNLGRSISFNNIPENGIIYIDNGIGDNIIEIKKNTGTENYDFLFHGKIQGITATEPNQFVTKDYVDSGFQHKLDTFGGTINGDLEITGSLDVSGFSATDEISTEKDFFLGTTDSNTSIIHFNYGGTDKGVIFYDNVSDEFKIGQSVGTSNTIYDKNNLDVSVFLDKTVNNVLKTHLTLDSNDIMNPNKFKVQSNSNYFDINFNNFEIYNEGSSFGIENSISETTIKFNSNIIIIKENEPPLVNYLPTKQNHLVIREYVDTNYFPIIGGELQGYLDTTERISVGIDPLTSNSTLFFNYGRNSETKIYFENLTNELKVDINATEGYNIYHSGNLNMNDYLEIAGGNLIGSLSINSNDTNNPSTLSVYNGSSTYSKIEANTIRLNNNVNEFIIDNDPLNDIRFIINSTEVIKFKDGAAPETLYSPSNGNSLANKAYVDSNFVSKTGGTILGNVNISESLAVGKEGSYSIIRFNYDYSTGLPINGALFLDNTDNTFRLNILANEGYEIFHEGNFDPKNYLNIYEDTTIDGSLVLEASDPAIEAHITIKDGNFYSLLAKDELKIQKNTDFIMELTDTNEVLFNINSINSMKLKKSVAPQTDFNPVNDEDLTRKDYVDNNFISTNGGILKNSLIIGNVTDDNHLILKSSDSFDENASLIISRPDGTYRFEVFANIDNSAANLVLYSADGSAILNKTSIINNGNVRVLDNTIPNSPWDLTTKDYVDDNLLLKADSIWAQTELDSKLDKTGGTISGDLTVNQDLRGEFVIATNNVTALGSINVGLNGNGNSAMQFNYDNGNNGVLYYDNAESVPENRFKLDITTAEEEYVILHRRPIKHVVYQ